MSHSFDWIDDLRGTFVEFSVEDAVPGVLQYQVQFRDLREFVSSSTCTRFDTSSTRSNASILVSRLLHVHLRSYSHN
jgi:hypothetical protein